MGCVVEWHRRPLRHGRRRPMFLLATRSKAMFLLWTEPKGPVVLPVVSWGAGLGRELPLEAGSGPVLGPSRSCPDLWSGPGFGLALVFVLASATATAFASRSYYEASQASCVVVVAAVAAVAATILPLLALTSNSTSNRPTITDKTKQNRIGKTNQKKIKESTN